MIGGGGFGDPDFVVNVPTEQYRRSFHFFSNPTYPESNLVVVRTKKNAAFADVNLDCAGVLSGWKSIGDYEWARVDLSTGNFEGVGGCGPGAHHIESEAPFGLWVWGWGTPPTGTQWGSYGYPGGMNVLPINDIVLATMPK
jgi:hypothetical protein